MQESNLKEDNSMKERRKKAAVLVLIGLICLMLVGCSQKSELELLEERSRALEYASDSLNQRQREFESAWQDYQYWSGKLGR